AEQQTVAQRRVDIDDRQLVEAVHGQQVDFAIWAARHGRAECAHTAFERVLTFQKRGCHLIFRETRARPKHGDASSSRRPASRLLRCDGIDGRWSWCLGGGGCLGGWGGLSGGG